MKNLRRLLSYYKPHMKMFWADMFFATLSAGIALVIPLVVRYVTKTLIYLPSEEIIRQIIQIGIVAVAGADRQKLLNPLFQRFHSGTPSID